MKKKYSSLKKEKIHANKFSYSKIIFNITYNSLYYLL